VFEGLPDLARAGCLRADTVEGMSGAIAGLLEQAPADRRALARRADLRSLEWEEQLRPLRSLLEPAADRRIPAVA
jgi:hypothetical protein